MLEYRHEWRIVVGPEETPIKTANINHEGILRGNGGKVNTKIPGYRVTRAAQEPISSRFIEQNHTVNSIRRMANSFPAREMTFCLRKRPQNDKVFFASPRKPGIPAKKLL
jgi:hypothetical protein